MTANNKSAIVVMEGYSVPNTFNLITKSSTRRFTICKKSTKKAYTEPEMLNVYGVELSVAGAADPR